MMTATNDRDWDAGAGAERSGQEALHTSNRYINRARQLFRDFPVYVNCLAAVQVLVSLTGTLSITPNPRGLLILCAAISTLLVLCRKGMEWRLRFQREWLTAFRKTCSQMLGLVRLGEIGPDDWVTYNGGSYGTQMFTMVGFGLILSFIWEGKWMGVLSLTLDVGYYFITGTSGSPLVITDAIRINVMSQLVITFLLGSSYTEDSARRAVIIRTFGSLSAIEPLDELFVHIVVMMTSMILLRFGVESSVLFLPLRIFGFVVLPIELMGLRPLLAKWSHQRSIRITASNRVAIVLTAIPVSLVFFSYGKRIAGALSFFNVLMLINLALVCVASGSWGALLDQAIHPTLLASYVMNKKPAGSVALFPLRHLIVAVAAICFVHEFFLYGALVLGVAVLANQLSSKAGGSSGNIRDETRDRRLLLLCYAFLFMDPQVRQNDSLIVMLSSSRIILAFENRRFSEVAREFCAMNALQIFLSSPRIQGTVSLLSGCGLAAALATAIMQENALQLLKVVKGADSFLDHALKQKFSSVGAAVNQVLEISAKDFDSLQYQSLVKVLQECREGQNSCYLSSYAIQYQAGATPGSNVQRTTRDLRQQIKEWVEEGLLTNCHVEFDPLESSKSMEIITDFDLLKVLLCDMTKKTDNQTSLSLKVVRTKRSVQIRLQWAFEEVRVAKTNRLKNNESELKQNFIYGMRKTVASALGAVLINDILEFPLASGPKDSSLEFLFSSPGRDHSGNTVRSTSSLTRRLSPLLPVAPLTTLTPDGSRSLHKFNSGESSSSSSSWRWAVSLSESNKSNSIGGSNNSSICGGGLGCSGGGGERAISHRLPPNLAIAALDDSKIIRKSLAHMFKQHLQASPESFATGATIEEAQFFAHEICLKNVDIAIFDENLDYAHQDKMVKGTTLAMQARQLGFKKCAILHSANVELGKHLDRAFNGFVEKTASREDFVRNVAKVWDDFLRSDGTKSCEVVG